MRKQIAVVAVVSVSAGIAASASADDPPVTKAATRTVELGDNFFKPKSMTVRKNTILRFVWGPGNRGTIEEHNVMGIRGNKFGPTPDTTKPSRPFRKRITKSSTIVCNIHATTMILKVRVKR